jgi:Sortase domain
MAFRLSRRRAAARGLTLLAGFGIAALWRVRPISSQTLDPPGDAPWTEPAPAWPPLVREDGSGAPTGEANDETSPADEPLPEAAAPGPWGMPPVKLTIPALGVEAAVEPVGQDPDGAMSAPTHPDDVAWYELGPGMGVPGNVVFAAHVNWDGRLRPFGLLHQLRAGDAVQVIDAQGRGFEYLVESSQWVRAEGAPVEEIFAQPVVPVVTLITCGGEYIAATREYLDRLVVRARGA